MDCPAEERLVRMALEGRDTVARLDFDLANRRLAVTHEGPAEAILAQLVPLNLGARIGAGEHPAPTVGLPEGGGADEAATLRLLLAINATMFVVELAAGWLAQSAGLIADSLDMFADAAVYGVSLYAVGKAASVQAAAARISGYLQLLLALGALLEVARRLVAGSEPHSGVMMSIALLALVANASCMALIAKHRGGGVHMRASWIFSTNDVIANVGVIVAAALVFWTGSALPDLVIGTAIALVVLYGAFRILRISRGSAARQG